MHFAHNGVEPVRLITSLDGLHEDTCQLPGVHPCKREQSAKGIALLKQVALNIDCNCCYDSEMKLTCSWSTATGVAADLDSTAVGGAPCTRVHEA